ncbi:MAG: hypothetical protein KGO02_12530, partial [Alphaproteobacteria bacterium]|nr:hypothetical protein [Alphaproteobacteria bacterium]
RGLTRVIPQASNKIPEHEYHVGAELADSNQIGAQHDEYCGYRRNCRQVPPFTVGKIINVHFLNSSFTA